MKTIFVAFLCAALPLSALADINLTNIVLASGLNTNDTLLAVTNHTHAARATVQQVIDLSRGQIESSTNLNYYWTTNFTLQVFTNVLNSTTNLNYYWTTNFTLQVFTNVTFQVVSNYFLTNTVSAVLVKGLFSYVFDNADPFSTNFTVVSSLPETGLYRFTMAATLTGGTGDYDPGGGTYEEFKLTYSDRLVDSPVTTAAIPMTLVRDGPPTHGRLDYTQVFQGFAGSPVSFEWSHVALAVNVNPITNMTTYSIERLQ